MIRRKVISVIALPVAHIVRLECGHQLGQYALTEEDVKLLGDNPVCHACTEEEETIQELEARLAALKAKKQSG